MATRGAPDFNDRFRWAGPVFALALGVVVLGTAAAVPRLAGRLGGSADPARCPPVAPD